MGLCCCFGLLLLAGVCGALYLYFPTGCSQPEGLALCQRYGMTLLELRNQTQLDTWNDIKSSLDSLQNEPVTDTWLGMEHDGSLNGSEANFRWLDGGPVTFLTWAINEPDQLSVDRCLRARPEGFATRACTGWSYSVACQMPISSQDDEVPMYVYMRTYYSATSQERYMRYSRVSLTSQGMPQGLWLLARPLPSGADDVISCANLCLDSPDCVTTFDHSAGCDLFDKVSLSSIH